MDCKYLLTLLLFICVASISWGQITVTGVVRDADNNLEPLIGVTIQEKDTDKGTVTDLDGRYTITVSNADAVLIFRYTGYATAEMAVDGRTQLDVNLTEEAQVFEELVVVGYGIQKKSDLTGAVSTVKGKDIGRITSANVEQALQGKVAGVYVSPASGAPGAGAVIRIRGTGTLNNANPLYVIDGMITDDATFVNPEDVESIEVLKDASAAAIYGSRGANGVIIITTKTGFPREKAFITASSYYGTQQVTKKIELLNGAEFASAYNDLRGQMFYPNPDTFGVGTDWQDQIFRDAPIYKASLSANGGGEKFRYNFSGNYFSQDGIIKNSHFDRFILRMNAEYDLTPSIALGHNLSYGTVRGQQPPDVIGSALRMPSVLTPRDETGDFTDPTFFGLAMANPAADLFYKSNNHETGNRLFGNVYTNIKILKDFTFRSNFGIDKGQFRNRYFEPKFEVSGSQRNLNDRLSVGMHTGSEWIWEQTLTYDRTWNDKHHVTILGGYTAEERQFENIGGSRENFPGTADELLYLSSGNDTTQLNSQTAGDEALTSWLFRVNYTLMDKYLFTFSWRTDKSSRFLKENRTGHFPSGSIGWNISSEPFMADFPVIDRMKIRASYGILGNQSASSLYPSIGAVTNGLYGIFGTDESLNFGATLTSLSNANLRWETSKQTDIGLEVGLFEGQLGFEIDWYERHTYDIIAAVPIPDYVGSQNDPVVNTAEVKNSGIDLSANFIEPGKITYNIGFNISTVNNRVVKLAEGRNEIFAAFLQGEPATHTIVGLPIGAFYGYKVAGVFQSVEEINSLPTIGNEVPGDLRFEDIDGDGVITGDDRVYLGSSIPKLIYSMTGGINWNGLDLTADVIGVSGNKVFNAKETFRFAVYNWEKHVVDRWTPNNPSNTEPRITNGGHNYRVSDRFIEDGSFIRLRSITLGYTVPVDVTSKAGVSRLRLYITGTNIWTSQKYSGYSPEFANATNSYEVGFDFGGYPVAKTWLGGIEIQF